ncbi:hypothetical protein BJ546DRAFT_1011422 [Cryomyces antarcticus]
MFRSLKHFLDIPQPCALSRAQSTTSSDPQDPETSYRLSLTLYHHTSFACAQRHRIGSIAYLSSPPYSSHASSSLRPSRTLSNLVRGCSRSSAPLNRTPVPTRTHQEHHPRLPQRDRLDAPRFEGQHRSGPEHQQLVGHGRLASLRQVHHSTRDCYLRGWLYCSLFLSRSRRWRCCCCCGCGEG